MKLTPSPVFSSAISPAKSSADIDAQTQVNFITYLQRLLVEDEFTATYKFALLQLTSLGTNNELTTCVKTISKLHQFIIN